MRVAFVVDIRSPFAKTWVRAVQGAGVDPVILSTGPPGASDEFPVVEHLTSVASLARSTLPHLSRAHRPPAPAGAGSGAGPASGVIDRLRRVGPRLRAPADVTAAMTGVPALRRALRRHRVDLVHAMRIPYEAIMATAAKSDLPLVVSVWGNDFTLWAASSSIVERMTRATMHRADALHADCRRDATLATQYGFDAAKPVVVLPGSLGVDTTTFSPRAPDTRTTAHTFLAPRGVRRYVRNDVLLDAVRLVRETIPDVRLLMLAGHDAAVLSGLVRERGLEANVTVLDQATPHDVADLLHRSVASVSPATHDGTPNSLLEAMATGCLPVFSDLDSVREWVVHGENGLLFDPSDAAQLAGQMIRASTDGELRSRAARANQSIIAERASLETGVVTAMGLYELALAGRARR